MYNSLIKIMTDKGFIKEISEYLTLQLDYKLNTKVNKDNKSELLDKINGFMSENDIDNLIIYNEINKIYKFKIKEIHQHYFNIIKKYFDPHPKSTKEKYETDYYSKYMKYKQKYLELKAIKEGRYSINQ